MDLIIECDGSTRKSSPGPASYGFVAIGSFGNILYEDCGLIDDHCTSSEAECWAAIQSLEFAKDLGYVRSLELRSDSLGMVRHVNGNGGFRSGELSKLSRLTKTVVGLIQGFDLVNLVWIPREKNRHADALANAAFASNVAAAIRKINRKALQ